MLPEGLTAEIRMGSWPVLPIFTLLKEWGNIEDREMFNTFNMGIGMVLACSPDHAEGILDLFCQEGYGAYIIGKVVQGSQGVVFVP
jgi:phosphoribosylformylglycinamidine cyclo-ligase